MSEVTPPPPPPPPTTPPTPTVAQPTVTVANPPDALVRQLSLGARLEAVIAATAPKGQFQVETSFGRFVIQTGYPLPAAGPLQLQLLAKGPLLQFLITAIHGLPPQAALRALGLGPAGAAAGGEAPLPQAATPQAGATAAAGGGSPGSPAAIAGTTRGEPTPVNLTVGATLAATLLKAGPPPTPGTTPSAPGVSGQTQAGPQPPGPGQTVLPPQAPAAATGATARPGAPQASGTPPAEAPVPAGGFRAPPGTLFSVRITAFQPAVQAPGAGAPPVPAAGGDLIPGSTLAGVVTGTAVPSGHPIVQTYGGSLVIATRTPLPPGSTVTFEILSQAAPAAETGKPSAVHPAGPTALLAERWPGLEEAIRTLEEVNPALAQQLTHAVLPRPGAMLAGNILFFMVALTGGNLRAWIGDGPARVLQRVKPGLLDRLGDEFGRIRAGAEEPRPGGDWRTLMIPFMSGAELEQIRLFLRPGAENPEDDEEEGGKGTRFIIELDLSRMGRFQLDGMVHQKDKRLDLIVRTEEKLPQRIQDDIRGIFQDSNEVTGLKGGLSFQAAPPHFVEVLGAEPPEDHLGLIV